jgi:hypothetical protein
MAMTDYRLGISRCQLVEPDLNFERPQLTQRNSTKMLYEVVLDLVWRWPDSASPLKSKPASWKRLGQNIESDSGWTLKGRFREVASIDCDESGAVARACGDHST